MFSIYGNSYIKLWRNRITSRKIPNIKLFITKYNWKGTNYLSKIDDWKTFEKNNQKLALNILYIK